MKAIITRPVPIREQAYDTIKKAILSGEFAPRAVISERELCEQLAVSRTPVREALQRLELEGYLSFSPRQGVVIHESPIQSPEEIFTLLGVLEGLAARWAAERATFSQLESLRLFLERSANRVVDDRSAATVHQEFIDLILDMAGSDRLKRLMAPLHDFRKHMMAVGYLKPGRLSQALDEHQEIFRAIAAHDRQSAEELVRNHLEQSLKAYQVSLSDPVQPL